MRRSYLTWVAVGLLLLLVVIIGLVVNRVQPDSETMPSLAGRPTTSPLEAASAIAIQTVTTQAEAAPLLQPGTPTQVGELAGTAITTAQPAQLETPTPGSDAGAATPSPAATPASTTTIAPTPRTTVAPLSASSSPTPGSSATRLATSTPTATVSQETSPTSTPTSRPAVTPTPRPSFTPRPTAIPPPPGISGRVLLNGAPADPGVILVLEDQALNLIAETTVGPNGRYLFTDLSPSTAGYNVTFSWELNQVYGVDEVIAWGWIGPVAYDELEAIQLPDMEIGLVGLEHIQPEPDTSLPAAAISETTPLTFLWSEHLNAAEYWVDLLEGSSFDMVWRSPFSPFPAIDFTGQLENGDSIQPGVYWWAVGGQGMKEGFPITIYGHLAGLRLTAEEQQSVPWIPSN